MLLIRLLAEHHDHLRDIHLHPARDDSDSSLATVLNLASCGNFLKPDLLSSIADGLHWDKELIQVILWVTAVISTVLDLPIDLQTKVPV
jgi:hypothetical protein